MLDCLVSLSLLLYDSSRQRKLGGLYFGAFSEVEESQRLDSSSAIAVIGSSPMAVKFIAEVHEHHPNIETHVILMQSRHLLPSTNAKVVNLVEELLTQDGSVILHRGFRFHSVVEKGGKFEIQDCAGNSSILPPAHSFF